MRDYQYIQCKNEPGYFEAFQLDLQRGWETLKPLPPKSQIGTRLKVIIHRENPGVVSCGDCSAMVAELNQMNREEVLADIDRIVSEIARRAAANAPKLWKRIAVMIDQTLHIGETERRIKSWVIEALDNENAPAG